MGMPLTVVPLSSEEARDLYQADLVLIRPDQIVAWRGNSSAEASVVLVKRQVTSECHSLVEALVGRSRLSLSFTATDRHQLKGRVRRLPNIVQSRDPGPRHTWAFCDRRAAVGSLLPPGHTTRQTMMCPQPLIAGAGYGHRGWLRSLGLGKYEAAFRENEIDETVLTDLTAEDLKELGVTALGHRRKLLDAIAALRGEASGKSPSVDAATRRVPKRSSRRPRRTPPSHGDVL